MKSSNFSLLNKSTLYAVLVSILLSSCIGARYLEKDEKLLVNQDIDGISGSLNDEAEGFYTQKKNTRLFSALPFTHLAYLHKLGENGVLFLNGFNKGHAIAKRDSINSKYNDKIAKSTNEKKTKRLRLKKANKTDKINRKIKEGNQLMRWGEPLAIYNANSSKETQEKINKFLLTKGFLDVLSEIEISPIKKNDQLVDVHYNISPGLRYRIDSIQYNIQDSTLAKLLADNRRKSPLKTGPYDQSTLAEQRDYLYNFAINHGYFDFSKQYISFQIDSIQLEKGNLIVRQNIQNPENASNHKIFKLDSIVFTADASLTEQQKRTVETYDNLTFSFANNKYSKKILKWRIPLEKGALYSKDLTTETQRQLLFLDNFKFVNINYDSTGGKFIANIFTSPFPKYQTSSEFGLTSTQGIPGPFFNINLKNRNTFRGMEIIGFDGNLSLEDLNSVIENNSSSSNPINSGSDESPIYSSRQIGGEISISIPQFLIPYLRYYKKKTGLYNPITRLSFGVSFEDRNSEYTRFVYQGTYSYSWQVKDKTRYTFVPAQLSIVDTNIEELFQDRLNEIGTDQNAFVVSFQPASVNSTSFQLDKTLGRYSINEDGGFISFRVEHGGHYNGIFGSNTFGDRFEYFRYAKSQIDLRKIEKIARRTNIAYRLNIGVGIPYSDNLSLPYGKAFYAGGSSGIRAWRQRRLGPGAFAEYINTPENNDEPINLDSDYNKVDYSREQPGDLLIESSFELRQNLVGLLEGAVFVDAGNIWLLRSNTIDPTDDGDAQDDGVFRFNKFIDEVAVGAGVGLRFDLSFLVFRLDLAMKMFDPAQPAGQRFVGDQFFSKFSYLRELNIGIGYPF